MLDLTHYLKQLQEKPPGGSPPNPPEGPSGSDQDDNRPMEARIVKLEDFAVDTRERLTRIETKLDSVATKAELHDMKAELIKWMVGLAVGLGVAAITVMTFVLNNAAPKVATVSQPPSIIINVPPAPIAAPALPPK